MGKCSTKAGNKCINEEMSVKIACYVNDSMEPGSLPLWPQWYIIHLPLVISIFWFGCVNSWMYQKFSNWVGCHVKDLIRIAFKDVYDYYVAVVQVWIIRWRKMHRSQSRFFNSRHFQGQLNRYVFTMELVLENHSIYNYNDRKMWKWGLYCGYLWSEWNTYSGKQAPSLLPNVLDTWNLLLRVTCWVAWLV